MKFKVVRLASEIKNTRVLLHIKRKYNIYYIRDT